MGLTMFWKKKKPPLEPKFVDLETWDIHFHTADGKVYTLQWEGHPVVSGDKWGWMPATQKVKNYLLMQRDLKATDKDGTEITYPYHSIVKIVWAEKGEKLFDIHQPVT